MTLPVLARSARTQLVFAAGALAVVAILLACFPPGRYGFYPSCPFHEWLGLECPGCGMTRAFADLMAGRMRDAARDNAMLFGLAPAFAGFAMVQSYSALRWNCWRPMRAPQQLVAATAAAMLIFGVLRNI